MRDESRSPRPLDPRRSLDNRSPDSPQRSPSQPDSRPPDPPTPGILRTGPAVEDGEPLATLLAIIPELDAADEPDAAEARGPDCLSLTRLDAIATQRTTETAREVAHRNECRLCRLRLKFLVAAVTRPTEQADAKPLPPSAQPITQPSNQGVERVRATGIRQVPRRIARLGALAAALALAVLLWQVADGPQRGLPVPPRDVAESPSVDTQAGNGNVGHLTVFEGTASDEDDCRIAYVRGQGDSPEGRMDQIHVEAEEDVSLLAFLRTWDETCSCLRWTLHRWVDEHGCAIVRPTLREGESLSLAFDATRVPPVEQLVMVVTARHAGNLPASEDEARLMLHCLQNPNTCSDEDHPCALALAPTCFPEGVELVSHSFRVE